MKTFIRVHIHSCFASFSSEDFILYKETDIEGIDKIKECMSDVTSKIKFGYVTYYFPKNEEMIRIVSFQDTTYYNVDNFLEKGASQSEMESTANIYVENGFSDGEIPILCNAYEEVEEIQREYLRSKGFILWDKYENWTKDLLRGVLCEELLNNPDLKDYIDNGGVWGYLGHTNRRYQTDFWFNEYVKEHPEHTDAIAIWMTSTYARHFMDRAYEEIETELFRIEDEIDEIISRGKRVRIYNG